MEVEREWDRPEGGAGRGQESTARTMATGAGPPYSLGVAGVGRPLGAGFVGEPHPRPPRGDQPPVPFPPWTRVLGLAVIAIVVVLTVRTHPEPAAAGRGLGISLALLAFVLDTAALLWIRQAPTRVQLPLLVAGALSAVALMALQPNGPGYIALLPSVMMAALRLPQGAGAIVIAVALVGLPLAWARHHPAQDIALNEVGTAAFFVFASFGRRLKEANARAEGAIAELTRTRAAAAQAAVLGERQRLAREMHDMLAHSLSGLVLNLEGARLLARRDGGDPAVGDAIDRAHRLARTGLEEARWAIGMLRDDDLPGPERLQSLASGFAADTGIACTLSTTGEEVELGTDARLTLYRVAQEALTNIRKHAHPERVEVRLSYEPAGTQLVVEDFASPASSRPPLGDGTGYGLTGMRERAELLGGRLEAGPTTAGFRVQLWVPSLGQPADRSTGASGEPVTAPPGDSPPARGAGAPPVPALPSPRTAGGSP